MYQQHRVSDAVLNLKYKWFILYRIEVSTAYEIDEGMVETYGFFYLTNYEVQMISPRNKEFLT